MITLASNVPCSSHRYATCGFVVSSNVPLPELRRSVDDAKPDVLIELVSCGVMHRSTASSMSLSFTVPELATYTIRHGKTIRIDAEPGSHWADLAIYLYGSAWAALCQQRGLLPLHASSVVVDGRIVAFIGDRGQGKSTIAAWLGREGLPLCGDDVLPVHIDATGYGKAWPFLQRPKLHSDSHKAIGVDGLEPEGALLPTGKRFHRMAQIADYQPWPLGRIYVLTDQAVESSFERLRGHQAMGSLIEHTHWLEVVHEQGLAANHLRLCAALAPKVKIYRWSRHRSLAAINFVGQSLLKHLNSCP
jgi:hypothetical protein